MQRRHAQLLAAGRDVLRGQHGGVGRALVSIGLDLHAAGDPDEGLAPGEVGHVHEGVVEGREEVGDGEHFLALDEVGNLGGRFAVRRVGDVDGSFERRSRGGRGRENDERHMGN